MIQEQLLWEEIADIPAVKCGFKFFILGNGPIMDPLEFKGWSLYEAQAQFKLLQSTFPLEVLFKSICCSCSKINGVSLQSLFK